MSTFSFDAKTKTVSFALPSIPATATGDFLVVAVARPAKDKQCRVIVIPAAQVALLDASIASQIAGYKDVGGVQTAVPKYADLIDYTQQQYAAQINAVVQNSAEVIAARATQANEAKAAADKLDAAIAAELGKIVGV